jgi:hypothetical protein
VRPTFLASRSELQSAAPASGCGRAWSEDATRKPVTLKPEVATGSGDVSRADDASPLLELLEAAEVTASAKLVSDGDATTGWAPGMPDSAAASAARRPCCCSSGGCCGEAENGSAGAVVVVSPPGLGGAPNAAVLPTLLAAGRSGATASGASAACIAAAAAGTEAAEGAAAGVGKAMAGTAAAAAAAAALDSSEELCRRRLAAEGERGEPPGGGLGDSGGRSADGGTAVPDACTRWRQQAWSVSKMVMEALRVQTMMFTVHSGVSCRHQQSGCM